MPASVPIRFIAVLLFILPLPAVAVAAPQETAHLDLGDKSVVVRHVDGVLRFSAPTKGVLRVEATPDGAFSTRQSLVLVSADPRPIRAERRETEVRVLSDGAEASVDLETGRIAFFRTGEDTPFLIASDRTAEPVEISGDRGYALSQRFVAEAEQGFYGLGTYQDGVMDWRGQSVRLAQANTMSALPVLVSSRGWGLLWHNSSRTLFSDDHREFSFDSVIGDAVDYLVLASRDLDSAIASYRRLTGRVPLLPLAAYGYWQSKERYESASELIAVAEEHRRRRLPLDFVVLDWMWWPDMRQWSGMVWDERRFPDPARMARQLHDLGTRLMVVVWPAVGVDSKLHSDLAALGGLFPGEHWAPAHVVDAWNDRARELYWDRAKTALLDKGVDGWWMDSTEPTFLYSGDRFITEELIVANGSNAGGSLARQLNTYSLAATRGAWEMQRAAAPDKRVLILTRSSFAGQQRYGATLWSGDISASWQVFRNQIAAGLHYALGGMPYWTTDIGGFGLLEHYPSGLEDPAYRELYVRWFQYAALSPIFRAHGTHVPREIWRFGDEGSMEYRALAGASRLRYRLLPYLYSLAAEVTHHHGTLMRPLVMDFPEDPGSRAAGTQYMLGRAILVSPVTQALERPTAAVQEAIPTNRLLGPDGHTQGLRVSYYRGTDFGEPVVQKTTELLRQPWYGGLPSQLDGAAYSVRFEGHLLTRAAGTYRFAVKTNGGVHLRLGGTTVIDQWDNSEEATFDGIVDLPSTATIPLTLEHRQPREETTGLSVQWEYPGLAEENWSRDGRFARRLPGPADWIDFWTGERASGGREIRAAVPLDRVPLDVRAGSILPLGPDLQWTGEKRADPIELRVYPGADGAFTLYEDAGDGYDYEEGAFALIPLSWDDRAGRLKIGARVGGFPGMLKSRTFNIVLVRPGHGFGLEVGSPDQVVEYSGEAVEVQLAFAAGSTG